LKLKGKPENKVGFVYSSLPVDIALADREVLLLAGGIAPERPVPLAADAVSPPPDAVGVAAVRAGVLAIVVIIASDAGAGGRAVSSSIAHIELGDACVYAIIILRTQWYIYAASRTASFTSCRAIGTFVITCNRDTGTAGSTSASLTSRTITIAASVVAADSRTTLTIASITTSGSALISGIGAGIGYATSSILTGLTKPIATRNLTVIWNAGTNIGNRS